MSKRMLVLIAFLIAAAFGTAGVVKAQEDLQARYNPEAFHKEHDENGVDCEKCHLQTYKSHGWVSADKKGVGRYAMPQNMSRKVDKTECLECHRWGALIITGHFMAANLPAQAMCTRNGEGLTVCGEANDWRDREREAQTILASKLGGECMPKKYGFAIDLRKCTGCYGCQSSCKMENKVSMGKSRAMVGIYDVGEYPKNKRYFLPVLCNHCENPPCIKACPVPGATFKRADGTVLVKEDLCIGCGYCALACPYDARYINSSTGKADK